jgi:hypothetical protein
MRLVLLVLLTIVAGNVFAGGEYDAALIPAALKENAHIVKRKEEVRFELMSDESVYRRKYALTVLNKEGAEMAALHEFYSKFVDISSIEGILYDAQGKEIRRLKNKEVLDLSAVDDNNLIDDSRRKYHSFDHTSYPYTVEYDVVVRIKNSYSMPSWTPQSGEHVAVQSSRITVVFPADNPLRYKVFNVKSKPLEGMEKSKKTLTWELKDLPAIREESYSPEWFDLVPTVWFAPSNFQYAGYKGSMKSWEEMGRFIYELNKGRDELPAGVKAKVAELTAGISDPRQKVKVLYNHLQKTTRYISIQLGIGGIQPLEAKFVAEKSYGDCKALTNYMYSLLKTAGIRSLYTLVRSGRFETIQSDFPSDPFNHIILCVPMEKDTMWLECTSQSIQAGYLGDFTADRHVLAVDENGGKLITTPTYRMKDNLQSRRVKATVNPDGAMKVSIATDYMAMQQDEVHGMIHSLTKQQVKEYLQKYLEFPTYELDRFDYKEFAGNLPGISENLDLSVYDYATISGKRLFIHPNLATRSKTKFPDEKRISDICIRYEYRDVDTAEIEIPAGYKPESVPQDVNLQTKYGTYRSSVKVKDNKIIYTRTMEQFRGRYPASEYEAISAYFASIYKADRSRVVLVKEAM